MHPYRSERVLSNWAAGDPNDGGFWSVTGEDCGVLKRNGLWNDYPCTHQFHFACKAKASELQKCRAMSFCVNRSKQVLCNVSSLLMKTVKCGCFVRNFLIFKKKKHWNTCTTGLIGLQKTGSWTSQFFELQREISNERILFCTCWSLPCVHTKAANIVLYCRLHDVC